MSDDQAQNKSTHRMYSTLLVSIMPLFAFMTPPLTLLAPGTSSGMDPDGGEPPSSFNKPPQISSGAGGELAACAVVEPFGVAPSRRHSGISVANSVIFSLMLSLRRRSTALWDSRRRRRFSFARRDCLSWTLPPTPPAEVGD